MKFFVINFDSKVVISQHDSMNSAREALKYVNGNCRVCTSIELNQLGIKNGE